jgi:uncharacterized protein YeaC (DUF1315 family)
MEIELTYYSRLNIIFNDQRINIHGHCAQKSSQELEERVLFASTTLDI